MNGLLERLGGFAARRHWIIIIAWLVLLGGLFGLRQAFGGEFVNKGPPLNYAGLSETDAYRVWYGDG